MNNNIRIIMFIILSILFYFQVTLKIKNYYIKDIETAKLNAKKESIINSNSKKISIIESKIKELNNIALKKNDFINFSYLLNKLINNKGLKASEIRFTGSKRSKDFTIRRLQFVISGEYERIIGFLIDIEHKFPFMIIDNVFQKEKNGKSTSLKFGGVLVMK